MTPKELYKLVIYKCTHSDWFNRERSVETARSIAHTAYLLIALLVSNLAYLMLMPSNKIYGFAYMVAVLLCFYINGWYLMARKMDVASWQKRFDRIESYTPQEKERANNIYKLFVALGILGFLLFVFVVVKIFFL